MGSIHFLQQFAGVLPRRVQRPLMARSAEASPYMGFVVEPYAFFLFSEVADCVRAEALLPEGFRLCKASVFVGDEPAHLAVQSFFRVHTSAFWGARAECYLMAQDERTGLLSWVIVDYLSDTISYDGAHGLRAPSAPRAVVTTTCEGRVVVDVQDAAGEGRVAFGASLAGARPRPLDRRMWVEGNLSVGYGRALSAEGADVFSLTFLPKEMERALEIPLENLDMACSTWHADILAPVRRGWRASPSPSTFFPTARGVRAGTPPSASWPAQPGPWTSTPCARSRLPRCARAWRRARCSRWGPWPPWRGRFSGKGEPGGAGGCGSGGAGWASGGRAAG